MMKKPPLLLLPLAALSALLVAGCGAVPSSTPPVVQTAVVARGRLNNSVSVSGKLQPVQYADLYSQAAGRVVAVNVDLGSKVQKGEVLLTLDSEAQAAALNQAQAAVTQARAAEQADEVAFANAKANYLRGQALLAQGAIPRGGQTGFDTAYKLPYQQTGVKLNQSDAAALQAAQAQLQAARAAYDDTILKAPFAGVITARNVDPGDMAAGSQAAVTGTPPLLVEVRLNPVYAAVNVDEDQVNGLAAGQKAQVTVPGASDRVLTGTISHVAAAADPSTKTYLVEVTLPNPAGVLKPGMFASVTFNENTAGYLLVPNRAIVRQGADNTVWVVRDHKAQCRSVQLGATDGSQTVVDAGLSAGDVVIVSGQQGLTQDERVSVKGP